MKKCLDYYQFVCQRSKESESQSNTICRTRAINLQACRLKYSWNNNVGILICQWSGIKRTALSMHKSSFIFFFFLTSSFFSFFNSEKQIRMSKEK